MQKKIWYPINGPLFLWIFRNHWKSMIWLIQHYVALRYEQTKIIPYIVHSKPPPLPCSIGPAFDACAQGGRRRSGSVSERGFKTSRTALVAKACHNRERREWCGGAGEKEWKDWHRHRHRHRYTQKKGRWLILSPFPTFRFPTFAKKSKP